jgi:formylglycine-generating enzyme required for sulfatase activity
MQPDGTTVADGGSDAPVDNPDVGPPPPDGGCAGKGGPIAVRVGAGPITYCVDATEVTRVQYDAFLSSGPSTSAQPAQCAWNTSFVPTEGWPYVVANKDHPVVGVDWCDAYAFCAWAGKRLCGATGPGVTFADREDPGKSEWVHACSAGGTRAYAYGNVWDPNACNSTEDPVSGLAPAGSFPNCQGGYPGVYDMTGSVHEWLGFCDAPAPDGGEAETSCAVSGSAFTHDNTDSKCTVVYAGWRSDRLDELGFRCCSP